MPPRPNVDLLLAVPRPKVMRRLWAQIAALGVGQIILTNAEKVERNYFDTHILAPETYRPLLIEGLQQARDTRLPAVSIHRQFKILIEDQLDDLFASGLRVVADPSAAMPLTDVVRRAPRTDPSGDRTGGRLERVRARAAARRTAFSPRHGSADAAHRHGVRRAARARHTHGPAKAGHYQTFRPSVSVCPALSRTVLSSVMSGFSRTSSLRQVMQQLQDVGEHAHRRHVGAGARAPAPRAASGRSAWS